ncbi:MAG: FtsH protease activity modulator HflK [Candidatus Marinimicrobia bacterium]|jgi:membrane protease subunit HflK|nr:FtsH protease activity modulator HflK [Candidatus Neomarinimicrobiota bacterium]MDD5709549.1 FtsH protease activity modulator HflK [Candidatus Neomarinimicrobiota bacterium]MDX9777449.1 FtsH protease activity modulator HflK [bacterium]
MAYAEEVKHNLVLNAKKILRGVLILLVIILLLSSFYVVQAENVGVVLRFGKYTKSTEPGLHIKIPFIDKVYQVAVERQLKEEFGFRTLKTGGGTQYSGRSYEAESVMLTGDLNVVIVEWIIQYRIENPYLFLFKVRNPQLTLRDMSEAVMREVAGDRTLNEILTVGRQEITQTVQDKLQDLCNEYQNGIRIRQIVLQNVDPPDAVKASFNEVNQAQQDREKLINQARSEYNRVIPRARGEAQQTIQEAEGYASARVNGARGDVARFNAVFEEYRKAPEITRQRIYLETLSQVLPRLEKKRVIDESTGGVLPLLNLDK